MPDQEKQLQGKRNRRRGSDWEREVRTDLESQGYIVSKWMNQIENMGDHYLISPCRPKFNPFLKRVVMLAGGFPDFIAFKPGEPCIAVECKLNGSLTREEKDKIKGYLELRVFSRFLVGYKTKDGALDYKEFNHDSVF